MALAIVLALRGVPTPGCQWALWLTRCGLPAREARGGVLGAEGGGTVTVGLALEYIVFKNRRWETLGKRFSLCRTCECACDKQAGH